MHSLMHFVTNIQSACRVDRTCPYRAVYITLACVVVGFAVHRWLRSDTQHDSHIEGMTQSKNLFLVGDSMLNNQLYVPDGDSVYHKLREHTNDTVHLLAKDDAIISDMYSQLHKIPSHFDKPSTYVCISAGGNNLLNMQSLLFTNSFQKDVREEIDAIFKEYIKFISAIKLRLPSATILLMNLYYPPSMPHLNKVVARWNELLRDTFTNDSVSKRIRVLEVDNALTDSTDFVSQIEPSSEGGDKLSKLIVGNLK